jgi:inorganic pyrophosphatase/predicted acetyltransferase
MLGKTVKVVVDRPLGSSHPKHEDIVYPVNYGYIPGLMAPDGEEQDAYILGIHEPLQEFEGRVIAIIHRLDDVEDKWVVVPEGMSFTKEEIMAQVAFQEQYFRTEIKVAREILRLVQAKPEEAEMAAGLQRLGFAELLERYQDHDTNPANEGVERILWKIRNPGSFYYFIKVGQNIVGAIRVVDEGNGTRKRISPLYILPEYRGKGYAQLAMLEAERIHGASHWELGTILEEKGNCYLYEKMGYHQTGSRTVINEKMTIVGYEKD